MKPLFLPKGNKREQGTYINCNKCNRLLSSNSKCTQSGKSLPTCKFGEFHRFVSMTYDPVKRQMVRLKHWPKELRDYEDFKILHLNLIKEHSFADIPKVFKWPRKLVDCINLYLAWEDDKDHFGNPLPSHLQKNKGEKTKQGIVNIMRHFKLALEENDINPLYTLIEDVKDFHAGLFHSYLGKFSPSTYNNAIAQMRAFYKFLNSKEVYNLTDPFHGIKSKETHARKEIISKSEFVKLLEVCTEENGWKFEKKGEGRVGRKRMFREWLVEGWIYALYSGDRPEEVAERKLDDLMGFYIDNTNFKVSRSKGTTVKRPIPISNELGIFIKRQRELYDLQKGDYLIAPKEENRNVVRNLLGGAFTHYMKQVDPDAKVTRYSLRNTYATIMIEKYGEEWAKMMGLHSNAATTYKHYVNQMVLAQKMEGFKFGTDW